MKKKSKRRNLFLPYVFELPRGVKEHIGAFNNFDDFKLYFEFIVGVPVDVSASAWWSTGKIRQLIQVKNQFEMVYRDPNQLLLNAYTNANDKRTWKFFCEWSQHQSCNRSKQCPLTEEFGDRMTGFTPVIRSVQTKRLELARLFQQFLTHEEEVRRYTQWSRLCTVRMVEERNMFTLQLHATSSGETDETRDPKEVEHLLEWRGIPNQHLLSDVDGTYMVPLSWRFSAQPVWYRSNSKCIRPGYTPPIDESLVSGEIQVQWNDIIPQYSQTSLASEFCWNDPTKLYDKSAIMYLHDRLEVCFHVGIEPSRFELVSYVDHIQAERALPLMLPTYFEAPCGTGNIIYYTLPKGLLGPLERVKFSDVQALKRRLRRNANHFIYQDRIYI